MHVSNRRERKFFHNRVIAFLLIAIGIGFGLVWFLFVSRVWSVTEFQIQGLRDIETGEVTRVTYEILDHGRWYPWDRRNIFFIDAQKLGTELARRLFVERVVVEKRFPDILRLIISERQRKVVLVTEYEALSVDTQGKILGNIHDSQLQKRLLDQIYAETQLAPVVFIGFISTTTVHESVAKPEAVQRWIETYYKLLAAKWRFKTFTLERVTSRTCKIAVEGGFEVIVDLESPLEPQMETFRRFLNARTKEMIVREYVNVTIPGKVSFR